MVNDRLPSMVEMVSASVAGGAGQCVLTEATRPQLLTCNMSDALAPGVVTSVITVVVKADITVASGSTIVNQAMVHGRLRRSRDERSRRRTAPHWCRASP